MGTGTGTGMDTDMEEGRKFALKRALGNYGPLVILRLLVLVFLI